MIDESSNWTPKQQRVLQALNGQQNFKSSTSFEGKSFGGQASNEKPHRPVRQRTSISIQNPYIKTGWDKEDEEELYKLHDQIGNKWAVIAHKMPGRTDNCVKNHFYSKLRKAMRKLNKYIHDFYRREFKEIKINAIYKIVEGNQEKHKPKTNIDPAVSDYCQKLKNRLLRFSDNNDLEEYEQKPEVRKMIAEIVQFNRNYRRQTRRKRKNSGNEDWGKSEYKKNRVKGDDEIFSSEEEEEEEQEELPQPTKTAPSATFPAKELLKSVEPVIPVLKTVPSKIDMDNNEDEGVESILLNAGMMEDNNMPLLSFNKNASILSRISSRPLSQQNNYDAFFEESEQNNPGKGFVFHQFDPYQQQNNHDFS